MRQKLVLYSIKERLEKLLGETAVFKDELIAKPTFYNGDYEPLPDFYIKGEGYKLAVELDLHLIRNSRYHLKMSEYGGSSQSHILYVVTNAKKITRFIEDFRSYKYVGITHYFDVKKLMSYRYGEISLCEWLKKDLNPRSKLRRF